MKMKKVKVVIGRFSGLHNGHINLLNVAASDADLVIVVIGSSFIAPNPKNPFSFSDRRYMLQEAVEAMPSMNNVGLRVVGVRDYANNSKWIAETERVVHEAITEFMPGENHEITLVGYEKDETSSYVHMFKWKKYLLSDAVNFNNRVLSATDIREALFNGQLESIKEGVPESTYRFLSRYAQSDAFNLMRAEKQYYTDYQAAASVAPYPIIYQTSDAVVVQSGHILLIERKHIPGQGLLALPGGFLHTNELRIDGMVRELREETRMKVPEPVIRRSVVKSEEFEDPNRSLRGRVITKAFLVQLDDTKDLPAVKAADDAKKAFWFPLSRIDEIQDRFFEDHYDIIKTLTGV
jgi:bifunctional NMN adenylyltransferase/nudix hydrolase